MRLKARLDRLADKVPPKPEKYPAEYVGDALDRFLETGDREQFDRDFALAAEKNHCASPQDLWDRLEALLAQEALIDADAEGGN